MSSRSPAWQALRAHGEAIRDLRTAEEFASDPGRAAAMSLDAAGLFLDYSKNRITAETLDLLFALANERGVEARRDAMVAGDHVNWTENRAALHMALRSPAGGRSYRVDGVDAGPVVSTVLAHMRDFSEAVRAGRWRGYRGGEITDVVNIGIGGSDLGPQMVCEALRSHAHARLSLHFVSNVDDAHLDRVLGRLDPATTLFIVSSKTFTTRETLVNAGSARTWLLASGAHESDIARHFVAVSANAAEVARFGIDPANMFAFRDWVGGRYSLWSPIGLSIALATGMACFEALLAGAHAMDEHFITAPLERNMPVLLALVGIWNTNVVGAASHCIAPYAQDLFRLPAYLQQLEMESNGKSVGRDGQPLCEASCPVVWGEPGTNGQHAFFQLIHQGTGIVPEDFIASISGSGARADHHRLLLANCFAQSEALMRGKSAAEVQAELRAQGLDDGATAALTPHKVFGGNRPSNTILLPALTPEALGALIALYEHKVFVQGVIWDVNSFDQWGVELGKQLAQTIDRELRDGAVGGGHDGSTLALMQRVLSAERDKTL